jgi:hypothetical protein
MVAGGIGGANTVTGKWFEVATDLKTALTEAGYNLENFIFCRQHDFPKYFKENTGLKMEDIFGKKFLPDEAVIYNDILYVVEKKRQGGQGSVDEKIQTGPYKLSIFKDCAKALGLKDAKYIYLLSGEYFNVPKFTVHQIPYLAKHGIQTYFDKLPLENLF